MPIHLDYKYTTNYIKVKRNKIDQPHHDEILLINSARKRFIDSQKYFSYLYLWNKIYSNLYYSQGHEGTNKK